MIRSEKLLDAPPTLVAAGVALSVWSPIFFLVWALRSATGKSFPDQEGTR
ncbi:putative membrane protein (plasmid) [Rhodococcus opacus]|uniref:Putative membrane protein n=1 Tax=Rhodococcus opacus TaxID=37919 RepID=A0A1B1KJ58_RHOOP|nr:hypothetical protein [Rhodococcus opacus]ANS32645.1 putative membrane protein [Rhodococcus opacus]